MKLNEYQQTSSSTVLESIKGNSAYMALGLCGEAGEIAEKIKKSIRDGKLDVNQLKLELGDCLWYLSQLSSCYGLDLEDIAVCNINKLQSRKKRGKISGNGDNR